MLNHIVLWYTSREFWFIQVGDFCFWQYARVIQVNSVNITPVQLQVGIDRFSCEWAGQLAASRSAAPFSCFSTVPELRPFASCSKARGCTDSSLTISLSSRLAFSDGETRTLDWHSSAPTGRRALIWVPRNLCHATLNYMMDWLVGWLALLAGEDYMG